MHFKNVVFTAIVCSILSFNHVKTQDEAELTQRTTKVDDDGMPEDKYTFVALIDITMMDFRKSTCTGAIIHDKVVITAAHCFVQLDYNESSQAELSLTFVIIGTKRMFDNGYEQYLPIERLLFHPKFKGWTADVALVYTFVSMTESRPGVAIPLSGDRYNTPVDSNVTVISWGLCPDDTQLNPSQTKIKPKKGTGVTAYRAATVETIDLNIQKENSMEPITIMKSSPHIKEKEGNAHKKKASKILRNSQEQSSKKPGKANTLTKAINQEALSMVIDCSEDGSPPECHKASPIEEDNESGLAVEEENPVSTLVELQRFRRAKAPDQLLLTPDQTTFKQTERLEPSIEALQHNRSKRSKYSDFGHRFMLSKLLARIGRSTNPDVLKSFKGWRRKMDHSIENKLTAETFGYVNVQSCKRLVQRAQPDTYAIKSGNEILCYSSEQHYITKEDAGAPAMQQGKLVAVTIGGIETDGDHIAVGMKMSCFCPWIAENLPSNGEDLECCQNCCDTQHFDQNQKKSTTSEKAKPSARRQRKIKAKRFHASNYDDIDEEKIPMTFPSPRPLDAHRHF